MSGDPVGVNVAVIGATGQVGGVMRQLLVDRDFPVGRMRYIASARSAGTTLPWKDDQITVEDIATTDLVRNRHRAFLRRWIDLEGVGAEVR